MQEPLNKLQVIFSCVIRWVYGNLARHTLGVETDLGMKLGVETFCITNPTPDKEFRLPRRVVKEPRWVELFCIINAKVMKILSSNVC